MSRLRNPKIIIMLFIAAVALPAAILQIRKAMIIKARSADNRKLISISDKLLNSNQETIKELTRLMKKSLAKKDISPADRVFIKKYGERIKENEIYIQEAVSIPARTEAARKLRASAIRYAAKASYFEYIMNYCDASVSTPQNAPDTTTCSLGAAENIISSLVSLDVELRRDSFDISGFKSPDEIAAMKPAHNKNTKSSTPNIIFILIDTLRADMTTGAKNRSITPEIDKLSRQGVIYTDITSSAPGTYSSVAGILSGLDPVESNAEPASKWDNSRSLIRSFKKAGYSTIGFSANSIVSSENGFSAGFDYFSGDYWPPAAAITKEATAYILSEYPASPFFLYFHLIDPHTPYFSPDCIPEAMKEKHPNDFVIDPQALREEAAKRGGKWTAERLPANVKYLKERYEKEIFYTDKWVGNFLDFLKKNGMLDNTLVIITADHGEQFYEHGDMTHNMDLWQELVHVPLILYGKLPPGLSPGQKVSVNHSSLEILPSILKWQGVTLTGTPARRAGLFESEEKQPDAPVFSITHCCKLDSPGEPAELISLRNGRYKIVVETKSGKMRLFDIAKDPGEQIDLSSIKPQMAKSMSARAMRVLMESENARNKTGIKHNPSPKLRKQLKSLGYIK